jgi:hypothetical protein
MIGYLNSNTSVATTTACLYDIDPTSYPDVASSRIDVDAILKVSSRLLAHLHPSYDHQEYFKLQPWIVNIICNKMINGNNDAAISVILTQLREVDDSKLYTDGYTQQHYDAFTTLFPAALAQPVPLPLLSVSSTATSEPISAKEMKQLKQLAKILIGEKKESGVARTISKVINSKNGGVARAVLNNPANVEFLRKYANCNNNSSDWRW